MQLTGSTGTLRQARARTKGKARAYLRRARSEFQRVVGNVEGKEVFMRLQYDVCHDIDPFVGVTLPIRSALTRFYSGKVMLGSLADIGLHAWRKLL